MSIANAPSKLVLTLAFDMEVPYGKVMDATEHKKLSEVLHNSVREAK
jgi:hypothetical protein